VPHQLLLQRHGLHLLLAQQARWWRGKRSCLLHQACCCYCLPAAHPASQSSACRDDLKLKELILKIVSGRMVSKTAWSLLLTLQLVLL
jgi:hypothetical protein